MVSNLQCVIHVRTRVSGSRVHNVAKVFIGSNLEIHAYGSLGDCSPIAAVVDGNRVIDRNSPRNGRVVVDIVELGGTPCPKNDGCGIRIPRRYTMSEVEVRSAVWRSARGSLVDLMDRNP